MSGKNVDKGLLQEFFGDEFDGLDEEDEAVEPAKEVIPPVKVEPPKPLMAEEQPALRKPTPPVVERMQVAKPKEPVEAVKFVTPSQAGRFTPADSGGIKMPPLPTLPPQAPLPTAFQDLTTISIHTEELDIEPDPPTQENLTPLRVRPTITLPPPATVAEPLFAETMIPEPIEPEETSPARIHLGLGSTKTVSSEAVSEQPKPAKPPHRAPISKPARLVWTPTGIEQQWHDAVDVLLAQADASENPGFWWWSAAQIYIHSLNEIHRADELIDRAITAGERSDEILKAGFDSAVRRQDAAMALRLAELRASLLPPEAAANALFESSLARRVIGLEQAYRLLSMASERQPSHQAVLYSWAELASEAGHTSELVHIWTRLSEQSTGVLKAEAAFEVGRLLLPSEPAQALSVWLEALDHDPMHPELSSSLIRWLPRKGGLEQVIQLAGRWQSRLAERTLLLAHGLAVFGPEPSLLQASADIPALIRDGIRRLETDGDVARAAEWAERLGMAGEEASAFRAAVLFERQGQIDRSIQSYQRAGAAEDVTRLTEQQAPLGIRLARLRGSTGPLLFWAALGANELGLAAEFAGEGVEQAWMAWIEHRTPDAAQRLRSTDAGWATAVLLGWNPQVAEETERWAVTSGDRWAWRMLAVSRWIAKDMEGSAAALLQAGEADAASALQWGAGKAKILSPAIADIVARLQMDVPPETSPLVTEPLVLAWNSKDSSHLDAVIALSPGVAVGLIEELGDTARVRGLADLAGPESVARALLRMNDARSAISLIKPRLEGSNQIREALVARMAAQRAGDLPALAAAYQKLTQLSDDSAKLGFALLGATIFESQGRTEDTAALWAIAWEISKSQFALNGLRRSQIALGDLEGLRSLHQDQAPEQLADALEAAGDVTGALTIWKTLGDKASLPILVRIEILAALEEDWAMVLAAVARRRREMRSSTETEKLDAKRQWILVEKLANSDAAWETYQKLHQENPEDREITEALARIAIRRGDTSFAVQFLQELVEHADTKVEAARFQRRIGEAYEAVGDTLQARQAYLDALDHAPEDIEVLTALRKLAETAGDYDGLMTVLQRQLGVATGQARSEIRREIARMTYKYRPDPWLAVDAWRSVLEEFPSDLEASEQLFLIAERLGDSSLILEFGRIRLLTLTGSDLTSLAERLGNVCRQDAQMDEAIRLLEIASFEEPSCLSAALSLEEILRSRADWDGAVRVGRRVVELTSDPKQKAIHLARIARHLLEGRQDIDGASAIYAEALQLDPEHIDALRFQVERTHSNSSESLDQFLRLEPHMESRDDLDDFDARLEVSEFYFKFANALVKAGRIDEATARFEHALQLNPAHLPTLEAIAPIYLERKAWKDAQRVLRQLLQLTGGTGDSHQVANTYVRLGQVELALGQGDKAQRRFAKALELSQHHIEALNGMASIMIERQDWPNVLNIYNNIIFKATERDQVVSAYITKGRILDERLNRLDKASSHYLGALEIDSDQPELYVRLADIAMRRGEADVASRYTEQGLLCASTQKLRAALLMCRMWARKTTGDRTGATADYLEASEDLSELRAIEMTDRDAIHALIMRILD